MNALAELGRLEALAFELPKKDPEGSPLAPSELHQGALSLTPNDRTSADVDVDPILRFDALSSLSLDAYERDLEKKVLRAALKHLGTLALRSAKKVRTLDMIAGLTALRSLLLQQLGALIDIGVLSSLPHLRALQLWRLAKVASVDAIFLDGHARVSLPARSPRSPVATAIVHVTQRRCSSRDDGAGAARLRGPRLPPRSQGASG